VNLMRRGATVTLGPVREPYISAFPRGDIFVERLLSGATMAESYWLSLPNVSWAMVILEDPFYRPFVLKPRPALVASAYISGDSNLSCRGVRSARCAFSWTAWGLPAPPRQPFWRYRNRESAWLRQEVPLPFGL
jgi:hypothetical protein